MPIGDLVLHYIFFLRLTELVLGPSAEIVLDAQLACPRARFTRISQTMTAAHQTMTASPAFDSTNGMHACASRSRVSKSSICPSKISGRSWQISFSSRSRKRPRLGSISRSGLRLSRISSDRPVPGRGVRSAEDRQTSGTAASPSAVVRFTRKRASCRSLQPYRGSRLLGSVTTGVT
jgi:hypothetical protein